MAEITNATADVAVNTDAKTETDPLVAQVEALNTEYNKSVEDLATAEDAVQQAQNTVFKFFLSVSKKSATTPGNEAVTSSSYSDVFHEFLALKEEVYSKQSASFRLLQKLRQAQNNYLMAVINSLQKDAADAKK